MKVSTLIASLAPFLAKDAKPEDITAAVEAQLALDKSAKDKAAKDKAAKDKAAKDGVLNLEGPETEIKYNDANDADMDDDDNAEDEDNEDPQEKGAAKDRAKAKDSKKAKDGNWGLGGKDKKAMDAAIDARVKAAVTADRALTEARTKVLPVIGVVAYDSAAEVYKAALAKLEIATDGVDPSAFATLFDVATKGGTGAGEGAPLATDSKTKSMSEAFPGFDRIRR